MAKLLTDFAPRFEQLEPSEGRLRQYKTAIFIFPDIKDCDAHETVDHVQAQVGWGRFCRVFDVWASHPDCLILGLSSLL